VGARDRAAPDARAGPSVARTLRHAARRGTRGRRPIGRRESGGRPASARMLAISAFTCGLSSHASGSTLGSGADQPQTTTLGVEHSVAPGRRRASSSRPGDSACHASRPSSVVIGCNPATGCSASPASVAGLSVPSTTPPATDEAALLVAQRGEHVDARAAPRRPSSSDHAEPR
jgi:hypothetical protein